MYETAISLLPADVFEKVDSALKRLKTFVEQRESSKLIFKQESALVAAQKWHESNINVKGNSLRFSVTLFGKETWTKKFTVFKNGLPAALGEFELTLRNDFASALKSARILKNGVVWNPDSVG